jgi:hypothetical protein
MILKELGLISMGHCWRGVLSMPSMSLERIDNDASDWGRESSRWLGRFAIEAVIRRGRGFHLYSCRDETGHACVVVVGAPRAEPLEVQKCLGRMAEAHRLLRHSHIPNVRQCHATSDGTAYLVFDCDAVMDMEAVMGGGLLNKVEYGHAIAFCLVVVSALSVAHAVTDPTTGGPLCRGSLAPANILVSATGKLWLLGFGHDPTTTDERGELVVDPHSVFLAPEVAAGGAPTPASDVYALAAFLRSFIGFAKLPDALVEAFSGGAGAEEIMAFVQKENEQIFAAPPRERLATLAEQIDLYAALWARLGIVSDPQGLAAFLMAAQRPSPSHPRVAPTLTVAADGSWFVPPTFPGARIPPRLRGLLCGLVSKRETAPGGHMDLEQLVAAGWPGEKIIPEAARNRGSSRRMARFPCFGRILINDSKRTSRLSEIQSAPQISAC